MTIWADGDSLQAQIRGLISRRARREAAAAASENRAARFRAVFVAARMPPLEFGPGVEAIVVGDSSKDVEGPPLSSEGAALRTVKGPPLSREGAGLRTVKGLQPLTADDYIAEHAAAGDLAVTRDLPLAERLAAKGLRVLNDRGEVFTAGNASERRSLRDAALELRALGLAPESSRRSTWGHKEFKAFADAFDRELAKADS